MLLAEDPRGPSFPSDFLLRSDDLGIVPGSVEEVAQHAETDARIRILGEEPVPEAATDGHRPPEPLHRIYARSRRWILVPHSIDSYRLSRFIGCSDIASNISDWCLLWL